MVENGYFFGYDTVSSFIHFFMHPNLHVSFLNIFQKK